MVSGLRKSLLVAAALCVAGCVTRTPSWSADMFGSPEADRYADFLAARYAGMVGDTTQAASYYRRALERSPKDSGALESAVFATLIAGDAATAADVASKADQMTAQASPSAQLALAVAEIADGRGVQALARLRSANVGPINQDMAAFLTAWLTAGTNVDAAVGWLSGPQGRRFPGGEPLYVQGLILTAARRDAEALKAFNEGARLPVGSPAMLVAAHARLLASMGRTDEARKLLQQQIAQGGPSAETEEVLGMLASGQPVKPPHLSVEEGAATVIYLASSGGLARSSPELMTMRLSLALLADPKFDPARLALADALDEQDRADDALAALAKIDKASPYFASARLKAASLEDKRGHADAALAAAGEAVAASRRRDILLGAGDIYRDQGRWTEAEKLFDEVVRADQAEGRKDWRSLFARAAAHEHAGSWAEAEADALAALTIEPKQPELLNFLGYGWVDRGVNVQKGMDLIREAVALKPDAGYIVDSLGWAHYRLGEYDKAVDELERAVELEPGDAEIVSHLGDAYWRTGRHLEASFEWRDVLLLKPKPELERAIKSRLSRGLDGEPAPSIVAQAPQGLP